MYVHLYLSDYSLLTLNFLSFTDDYRDFDGHLKRFEKAKYLCGLFSSRVFDTDAWSAQNNGTLLGTFAENEDQVHYNDRGMLPIDRPVQASWKKNHYEYDLRGAENVHGATNLREFDHTIRTHRLPLILADQLGLTVFTDGNLEAIGLVLPEGTKYDMHFNAYRPLNLRSNNERKTILRKLKYGDEYSRQCDGDHCLGSDRRFLYLHGLSCMTAVAHRTNICNSHTRRNAGHWCAGFILSSYTDGTTFNGVNTAFIERFSFEGGEAKFDGEPIAETNVFELLPPLENWIIGVDDEIINDDDDDDDDDDSE